MTTRELATEFMKNYAERKLRPSTVRGYRTNFNRHILPKLGDVEITTIKAGTLDQLNISMTIGNKSKIKTISFEKLQFFFFGGYESVLIVQIKIRL